MVYVYTNNKCCVALYEANYTTSIAKGGEEEHFRLLNWCGWHPELRQRWIRFIVKTISRKNTFAVIRDYLHLVSKELNPVPTIYPFINSTYAPGEPPILRVYQENQLKNYTDNMPSNPFKTSSLNPVSIQFNISCIEHHRGIRRDKNKQRYYLL